MVNAQFEFATATRILFGAGKLKEIGPITANIGRYALIVQGGNADRSLPLRSLLEGAGIGYSTFEVRGEPAIEDIVQGVRKARETNCDLGLGFGGGGVVGCAERRRAA